MRLDVRGRLDNHPVPKSNALLPVFEAVVNSIHATQELFGTEVATRGEVVVTLFRHAQMNLSQTGRRPVERIQAVEVRDNGVGFTDEHLESFQTADSRHKRALGGKGNGRFSWLSVFKAAQIESCFSDGQTLRKRSWTFQPTADAIHDLIEADGEGAPGTVVLLKDVENDYAEPLRKSIETIADRLFEHCFQYLVLGQCPSIVIKEDAISSEGVDPVGLKDLLERLSIGQPEDLVVGQHRLEVRHVQQRAARELKHEAYLCANHRVVTQFPLTKVSDITPDPIGRDGQQWVHLVFVSGSALDCAVDASRTRLMLPEEESLFGELDQKSLREAIGQNVNHHLADMLQSHREENARRIRQFIETSQPQYRHLLSMAPDRVAKLRWTDDSKEMDFALYQLGQAVELETRRRTAEVVKQLEKLQDEEVEEKPDVQAVNDKNAEIESVIAELGELLNESGQHQQATLIRYVLKRKAVLEVITRMLSRWTGQALEKHVHQIVFPMRKFANQIKFDEHNLWLVDDTLAFFEYIASDISFASNTQAPVESTRRPDVLAFKTGSPYQRVALIELKRPDLNANPVRQLIDYAKMLRKGGKCNANGVPMPPVDTSIRIEAYGLCSLSPEMEDEIATEPGEMKKGEQGRWYGFLSNLNLSIEVLDYRAFVERARERNHAFFHHLGLPT